MHVLLSDLHLGDGGPLDDFLLWGDAIAGPPPEARAAACRALDDAFARFLSTQMRRARAAGLEPTLLLNGDTFDLWQARRPGESPARALERVLTAHPGWVAAVRAWLGDGGRVELVVGNHDQPLVHPAAWGLLGEVMPGLNPSTRGAWRHWYTDAATGLYAEHGHAWDPHNRMRRLDRPDASCVGLQVVRRIVNPLEPVLPWIDKGIGMGHVLRGLTLPDARRLGIGNLIRALGRAPRLGQAIVQSLADPPVRAAWRAVAAREQAAWRSGARRAVAARHPGLLGRPPAGWRFLATGHTHVAGRAGAGAGVEHLNAGTWRPLLRWDAGPQEQRMVQPLGYGLLVPCGDGTWEASVRRWADEDSPQAHQSPS